MAPVEPKMTTHNASVWCEFQISQLILNSPHYCIYVYTATDVTDVPSEDGDKNIVMASDKTSK